MELLIPCLTLDQSGWFELAGTIVGGLGLFLLGMKMMTDGLKLAAGNALRNILAHGTKTRFRALTAGAGISAIVQSSSAVTVATIGFVNAGLLSLAGAVWVIFGSNVGTTTTGWIVAATGLKISIETYALPMAGIGLLMSATGSGHRRGAFGQILGGFGLFFLGLSFMQQAFGGIGESTDLSSFHPEGVSGILIFLTVGVVLTTLVQSSSAAIAITLTAATQGIINPTNAGAMVIGANLGTTSTAILSVIGATSDARRTASAHVFFNLVTACVAVALLPWLMGLVEYLVETVLDREASLAVLLAVFHTTFNVVGVLLMIPLGGWLVRFLSKRFKSAEEEEGNPRHLDASILQVPSLAVEALSLETKRLGHIAADMVRLSLDERPATVDHIGRRKETFNRLLSAISSSVQQLDRTALPQEVPAVIHQSVHATQHYLMAAELSEAIAQHRAEASKLAQFKLPSGLLEVLRAARSVVSMADPGSPEYSVNAASHSLGVLDERIDTLQKLNISEAAEGKRTARDVAWYQQLMTEARRAARRMVRAGEIMANSQTASQSSTPNPAK